MPFTDPEKQRQYAREWLRRRRDAYLIDKRCVKCGSTQELEIDHIDRLQKIDHKIWSWSATRREAELAKCQVLCAVCHREKTNSELHTPTPHGTQAGYSYRACRCVDCTAAHREYVQQWRKR